MRPSLPLRSLGPWLALWLALRLTRCSGRSSELVPRASRSLHRNLLRKWLGAGSLLLFPWPSSASERSSSSFYQERVRSFDENSFRTGIKDRDVFYPRWLDGTWFTNSTLIDVSAPLGVEVFGGQSLFEKARKDIGNSLLYQTKFIHDFEDENLLISDRLANIQSISKASIGGLTQVEPLNSPKDFASKLALRLQPSKDSNPLSITLDGMTCHSTSYRDKCEIACV